MKTGVMINGESHSVAMTMPSARQIGPRVPARVVAHIVCLALCGMLLCAVPGWAQTGAPAAPGPADAAKKPVAAEASLGHAALKGITLKATQGIYSFGVFTLAAGMTAAIGATMAVADGIGAYTIYIGNEYLWDKFYPNTNLRANNVSFGTVTSLSRTTLKYITYKPAVASWHYWMIYLATGSAQATIVAGSVLWFTLPLMFYVNDTAWNYYDWSATTGTAHPPNGVTQGVAH